MYKRTVHVWFVILALVLAGQALAAEQTLLLRTPDVSSTHVTFVYAGDIWVARLDGSEVRRLTVHPGLEQNPMFSPDGRTIAFSGNYDGNVDVYIVPVTGGSPQRLTFHPAADVVTDWSPDGQRVLFRSNRISHSGRYSRLFTVSVKGGFPEVLPMPMAERAAFSPDGKRIAYTPIRDAIRTWKRYRGGQTTPIWLFDLKSYDSEEIPHVNATDTNPVWIGDTVYFLSDRHGTMNIFAYNTTTKQLRQLTRYDDFDVKYLNGNSDYLVYEQAMRLHLLRLSDGSTRELSILINPDLPHVRPHFVKGQNFIRSGDISPTGKRAVLEVRGEIVTVPAEKGDMRNLTNTPGAHERYPSWSPDGRWIAYFSDQKGEYQLVIRDQKGEAPPRFIDLKEKTFFYSPQWSPDSKKIVFTDKRLNLFWLDVEKGKAVKIDTDTYDHPVRSLDPVWSPDSRWLAYTKRLVNHFRAVFLYNIETGQKVQVSDGLSDATSAAFSRDGKYLFFAASTDFGLNTGWLDMSSYDRPVTYGLYLVVLSKGEPSPFAPESDEEEVKEKQSEKKEEAKKEEKEKKNGVEVKIDLENIRHRILSLPVPERNYGDLQTAANGALFYLEYVPFRSRRILHKFDMKKRKSEEFLTDVTGYTISHDGKKMLYVQGNQYFIIDTASKPKAGDGKLNLSNLEIRVDPRQEWRQMFDEVWRIERDFFYDPHMHGADWPGVKKKYQPFLPFVGHRDDLNYLFAEMLGELVVGHAYVGGGDMPSTPRVNVGLLGADYEIASNRYRIKKIYTGENWNPDLRAPLTEPGVNVHEGDYILAVNNVPLNGDMNIYSLFQNTAGKQIELTVNSTPSEDGARKVVVVPVGSESGLRNRAWIEDNRRKVEELSGGKVAYAYLPNTGRAGYNYFNRYYFSQLDKEAVVIDERFNGGGSVADYIIDMLHRPLLSYWATREGRVFSSPNAAIFGPKVMIINEYAGSGGDAMPHFFRRRGLGKLVGKRTWGGLVGIYDYPPLMDGGYVTAPRLAIFSPDNQWEVENEGVPPDVEVEMTPRLVIQGHDPQLEKAVEIVLEELKKNPVPKPKRPPYPDRAKK